MHLFQKQLLVWHCALGINDCLLLSCENYYFFDYRKDGMYVLYMYILHIYCIYSLSWPGVGSNGGYECMLVYICETRYICSQVCIFFFHSKIGRKCNNKAKVYYSKSTIYHKLTRFEE